MANTSQSPKKMRLTSAIVTINVGTGDEVQSFLIHEDIIKDESDFFKSAFDRKWREGQSRVLDLPEDDPTTVSGYFEWLYSGQVKTKLNHELSLDERDTRDQHLSRMYVFGEKVQDNDLCDEIIRVFSRHCDEVLEGDERWAPGDDSIRILDDGTPSDSPARRFFVDLHVVRGHVGWVDSDIDRYHAEFLLDLTRALFRKHANSREDMIKHTAVDHVGEYLKKRAS